MKILKIRTQQRKTGNLGERRAMLYLILHGYRILERNYTALGAEIDIIARKKNLTAFIEVKARNIKHLDRMGIRPASAVDSEKQRKIIKTANYYMAHNPHGGRLRFDVIEIYLEDKSRGVRVKDIKHLIGAFDNDTAYKNNAYQRN